MTGMELLQILVHETFHVEAGRHGLTRILFGEGAFPWGGSAAASDGSAEGLEFARRGLAELHEYLAGERREFDLPIDLDAIEGMTPFRRAVLEALLEIPYGTTVSYAELARRVGCPSARAVGQAVGWNPLPVLIPCHRVIASDGGMGGYSGGLRRKRFLMEIEGV